jgi:hypothetical protein
LTFALEYALRNLKKISRGKMDLDALALVTLANGENYFRKLQVRMTILMTPKLMTFKMAQANFEPTFSCIYTLTILKPSYYSPYPPAHEDGTDRVFRNVGIQNSDAGELPRRKKHTSKKLQEEFDK